MGLTGNSTKYPMMTQTTIVKYDPLAHVTETSEGNYSLQQGSFEVYYLR